MGIISDVLDQVTLGLLHPSSAGPTPVTNDDLVPIVTDIKWLGKTVDDVFAQAADQAALDTLQATAAGGDINNAVQDLKFSIEHTYKTVIPHSLDCLQGNIVRLYVTPLRQRVGKAEQRLTVLEKWRADIHAWRVNVVDPALADFGKFEQFWETWPLDMVTLLRGWTNKPDTFAQYWTPVIVPRFISYIGSDSNLPLLLTLLTELLDASPDRYRHAVAAFETILDQEWP